MLFGILPLSIKDHNKKLYHNLIKEDEKKKINK